MGFIPPLNLGNFQPSPATLSQWIYQIWQYLQENPIATEEQLKEYIGTFITTSPETQTMIGEGVEQYLTENPPTAPVQSVQGKTGTVTLNYPDIVPASNAVPVYRAASAPNASTAQGLYNNGYRLFVNTATQEIYTISPAGALSLVGRGKFDGTTVDLNSSEGDTTIAEAINAQGQTITAINQSLSTFMHGIVLPCELPGPINGGAVVDVSVVTTGLPDGSNVVIATGGYAGSIDCIIVNTYGWAENNPKATIRNISAGAVTPTTPFINVFYTL